MTSLVEKLSDGDDSFNTICFIIPVRIGYDGADVWCDMSSYPIVICENQDFQMFEQGMIIKIISVYTFGF